jgi:hypothetical protein
VKQDERRSVTPFQYRGWDPRKVNTSLSDREAGQQLLTSILDEDPTITLMPVNRSIHRCSPVGGWARIKLSAPA